MYRYGNLPTFRYSRASTDNRHYILLRNSQTTIELTVETSSKLCVECCQSWKLGKLELCENTPPFGRRVSTQFLVFQTSTRVDITVHQHGKCFIFVKY